VRAGKVPYITRERCWPAGVPGFTVYTRVQPIHFYQTAKEVTIINELNTQIRHVYMNVPHTKNPGHTWYGESVGKYEGDELVVDTIGLNDKTFVDNYRTPHTDQIHVVERWKLIEGGNILQATVTVKIRARSTCRGPACSVGRRSRARSRNISAKTAMSAFRLRRRSIPNATKPDF
jgi:hypothetical protein